VDDVDDAEDALLLIPAESELIGRNSGWSLTFKQFMLNLEQESHDVSSVQSLHLLVGSL